LIYQANKKDRVAILDGLRVIAISMVMIFHFYSCFESTYYSYSFKSPKIFSYGYLGVQFFFIISGFVITLSLTKCKSFFDFIKKRFIRLIPGMLICSLLTFITFNLFDDKNIISPASSIINLLVSNTFIPPNIINTIFKGNVSYIDASYWSLWVELQFYFLAGFIYFLSPAKFLRNFTIISLVLVVLIYCSDKEIVFSGKILWFTKVFLGIFSLSKSILWFLEGVIINFLYFSNKNINNNILLLLIFFIQILISMDVVITFFVLLSMTVFYCFLNTPRILNFLTKPIIQKIGVASYSIYLIHENIGLLIINKLSIFFGNLNWVIPIILIFLFSIFGILSFKYLENPIGRRLKLYFIKKNNGTNNQSN
jgi:peptidoglycan/LPS O-acetylase OafA/YrhL